MARHWKEQFNPKLHGNKMQEFPVREIRDVKLMPPWVYFVSVCSFTFEFHSIEQIKACLDYYSEKIHPSSRLSVNGGDHWEFQRWYERLPMYLLEEPKRQKFVKALRSALVEFESKDVAKVLR